MTQLIRRFLGRKSAGVRNDQLREILRPHQMRELTLYIFTLVGEFFPDKMESFSETDSQIHLTQQQWELLHDLHEEIVRRMLRENRYLTVQQQTFLKKMLKNGPSSKDRTRLSFFLGEVKPRRTKSDERQTLAQTAIQLRRGQTNHFSQEEWKYIQQTADGVPLSTLGISRPTFIRLVGKMKQYVTQQTS